MKLLLDTHALLWALAKPARIPRSTVARVREAQNLVYVSAASTWEIAIKSALGKLDVDPLELDRGIRESSFTELPISFAHTVRLRSLPPHHRDPFDRMIVAQALAEGLTIVTHDAAFRLYAAPVLW